MIEQKQFTLVLPLASVMMAAQTLNHEAKQNEELAEMYKSALACIKNPDEEDKAQMEAWQRAAIEQRALAVNLLEQLKPQNR